MYQNENDHMFAKYMRLQQTVFIYLVFHDCLVYVDVWQMVWLTQVFLLLCYPHYVTSRILDLSRWLWSLNSKKKNDFDFQLMWINTPYTYLYLVAIIHTYHGMDVLAVLRLEHLVLWGPVCIYGLRTIWPTLQIFKDFFFFRLCTIFICWHTNLNNRIGFYWNYCSVEFTIFSWCANFFLFLISFHFFFRIIEYITNDGEYAHQTI